MKKFSITKLFVFFLVVAASLTTVTAQKKGSVSKPNPPAKTKSVIFAVVNDGAGLEPIAYIENGKLTAPALGDSDPKIISAFAKSYYSPNTTYSLIFGGKTDGKVTVNKSNETAECSKTVAAISTQSGKAKIKGFIMALATNAAAKAGSGVRRMPTYAERADVETLVRAEFTYQKVSADALKNLHYHNLTAVDVDNDGKAELIGSYWVETAPTERARLFFIAEKGANGKYTFAYHDYQLTKESEVMNSEIKALDQGIYHELLLDVFDTDGDGVSEIFTVQNSFEGSTFNVYRRESGKWVKKYNVSDYHCAY